MSELREKLTTACESALAGQREALSALRSAEAFYQAGVHIYTNAFVVQMQRKDTPITPEEIVPALLSESPETIRTAMKAMGEEGGKELWQGCRALIEELRVKGIDVSEWDRKLPPE